MVGIGTSTQYNTKYLHTGNICWAGLLAQKEDKLQNHDTQCPVAKSWEKGWGVLKILDHSSQCMKSPLCSSKHTHTGELGYDGLNGTRKIGPSYAKSVIYIWQTLNMHGTRTKHLVRHRRKSVLQWSVISKFTCNIVIWQVHFDNIL